MIGSSVCENAQASVSHILACKVLCRSVIGQLGVIADSPCLGRCSAIAQELGLGGDLARTGAHVDKLAVLDVERCFWVLATDCDIALHGFTEITEDATAGKKVEGAGIAACDAECSGGGTHSQGEGQESTGRSHLEMLGNATKVGR